MPPSNKNDKVRPVGQFAQIEFPIGISLILALLVCAAGLVFWWYPRLHDILSFLGSAFAMAAGVVAAYYIGKTLQITVTQRDEALNSEKVDKAFSFIQRWNTAPFEERKAWRALIETLKAKTAPQITAALQAGADRALLVDVLNFFEEMCLAMNESLADEETLIKFFRDMLETYYSLFGEWINQQRTDHHRPSPRVYIQFEQVAKRWQQRN